MGTVEQLHEDLLRPLVRTSWRFWLLAVLLGAGTLAGLAAFAYQVTHGIGVAGIDRPVFWGVYITNYVFWIGISMSGTVISAMLRLTNASWRRPITRSAEAITAFALMIGAMFPIIHLGRPWLFYRLIPYPNERGLWPNFRSPLVWDFFAILIYFTGSSIFLLLTILPDWALAREFAAGWRRKLYGILSLGWRGAPREWARLETAMYILAILLIPLGISVHSVVSYVFAMTPVPTWHSTILAPYFVVGAIFSGVAMLILVMAIARQALALETYIERGHFDRLGKLLVVFSLLWFYFIVSERLTTWYGNESAEMAVYWLQMRGAYAAWFWTMMVCNFVVPVALVGIKRLRSIATTVLAALAVIFGMWVERFLIIVPALSRKSLPYAWGSYHPTWVELTITAATFCAMALLFTLFVKFVPAISVWELKLARHDGQAPRGGKPPAESAPVLAPEEPRPF
jgi:Ni/Fe-hydrogenase subunit HybB-like protein